MCVLFVNRYVFDIILKLSVCAKTEGQEVLFYFTERSEESRGGMSVY